jgi:hypothetical protein
MEYTLYQNLSIPAEIFNYISELNLLTRLNQSLYISKKYDINYLTNQNLTIEKLAVIMCLFSNENPDKIVSSVLIDFVFKEKWEDLFPKKIYVELMTWFNQKILFKDC